MDVPDPDADVEIPCDVVVFHEKVDVEFEVTFGIL